MSIKKIFSIFIISFVITTQVVFAKSGSECSSSAITIPDNNPTGTTQTITIDDPNNFTIKDLNVKINATHDHVGELTFTLEHDGITAILINESGIPNTPKGCAGQNIENLILDDEETSNNVENDCKDIAPAYTNGLSYHPFDNPALSKFNNENLGGNWILKIVDSYDFNQVAGTLIEWCLEYDLVSQTTFTLTPATPGPIAFGGGNNPIGTTVFDTITFKETSGIDELIIISASITGTDASNFIIVTPQASSLPVTVQPGKIYEVKASCTPTKEGDHTGILTIKTNVPGFDTLLYNLSCKGVGSGYSAKDTNDSILNSDNTLNFGSLNVDGAISTVDIKISATVGKADLVLSKSITGSHKSNFRIVNPTSFPHIITNGTTDEIITLECNPSKSKTREATLNFTTNDVNNSTVSYPLTCIGLGPEYKSTPLAPNDTLILGTPTPGTTVDNSFNIKNNGNEDLILTNEIIVDEIKWQGVFSVVLSLSISAGNNTTVTVTCDPSEAVSGSELDSFTGILKLTTNDSNSKAVSYPLTCSGTTNTEPLYDSVPSPNSLIDLGKAIAGNTTNETFLVREIGNADLIVDLPITTIGDFEISSNPDFSFTIAEGGANVIVTVKCTPSVIGETHTEKLIFDTNSANYPNPEYTLKCTAEKPVYNATNNPLLFGSVPIRQTSNKNFQIQEIGTKTSMTVNLDTTNSTTGITGTHASNFKIISPAFPFTINNNSSKIITVECEPTPPLGLLTATLNLTSDDPDNPKPTHILQCTAGEVVGSGYSSTPTKPGDKIDFGKTIINTIVTATFDIQEVGTKVLDIGLARSADITSVCKNISDNGYRNTCNATIVGVITGNNKDDFSVLSPFPFYIDNGSIETDRVTIQCNPSAVGIRTATLNLISSDTSNINPTYPLVCTGTPELIPVYTSIPAINSNINFGSDLINTITTKTIIIEEAGNTDLTITSATVTNSSDFALISPNFPLTINDGGNSETVTLQCNRNTVGNHTAQLQLITNDPNNSTVVYDLECISELPVQIDITSPNNLTITVDFAGDGSGNVTSDIAGIDCSANCSSEYESATKIKLTATPNSDSIFERWDGDGVCKYAEIFLVKDITCTAYFTLKPVESEVIVEPVETAIVKNPVIKPTCTQATEMLYVNQNANGYNSGLNWQDAFIDLQDALEAARNTCPNIKQIWIAKGTYYPTTNNERDVSFDLVNNVKIYGGFAGHEDGLSEQNCNAILTILSGDIGVKNNNSDNSQHVVTANGVSRNTWLNCLSITDGNATECGGGMFNDHASPTLKYISFSGNQAQYGAGLCNINDSNPLVQTSSISNNSANQEGGGIYNKTSSPVICQVFIQKNTAKYGAGIFNTEQSAPILKQANITDNNATQFGGGMFNNSSTPLITHSIISKNKSAQGAGMVNLDSKPLIGHLVLTANNSEAMLNDNSNPQITQSTIAFNQAGIVSYSSFPTISNSILWDITPIINKENSTTTVSYSIVNNGWEGKGNKSSDPLLTTNINNTLPTMADDVHLQVQSQAIDAGDNSLIPQYLSNSECDIFANDDEVDLDFDGKTRILDGNADGIETVDMGVHEANFSFTYLLTVELTGEGSGTVVSNGINCGNDCNHNYSSGIDVLLTATANSNSVFNGWSGDCASNGNVKMNGSKKCQAQFDLVTTDETDISELTDNACSLGNVIQTTCNFNGNTAEDILIEENGNISYAIFTTNINNKGRISNSEITADSTITGGILSGYIDNKGILADFEFLGAEISGGTLVGNIVNNSDASVNGIIRDVLLAPNTRITGGRLGGRIIGNADVPAILENLVITDGSYLSNVIIGNDVTSIGKVEYGPGIQFYFGTKKVPFEKTIVNEETIKDLTFRGKNLSGGTLDGAINITMGGTITNVKLTAGTKINGGNLQGKIIGDAKKPVILTNLSIVAGSYLENVIISKDVYLPDDVELGPNVTQFIEPEEEIEILPTALLIDKNLGVHELFDASFVANIKSGKFTYPNHAMLTFEEAKKLELSTNINPLPDDIDKSADMLVVVEHTDRDNPERNSIKILEPPKWNKWDNDIFSLKSMQHYQQLPLKLKLPIYTGDLNDIAEKVSFMSNGYRMFLTDTSGEYSFYIGYRLPDNSIVYNGPEPLHFFVDSGPESCILYALHDDKLNDTQVVTIDLSAGLKGDMTPLGPMQYGRDMEGLALHPDDPDLLFASAGNHANVDGKKLNGYLYTIHRKTGEMKVIGPTGFEKTAGLAFNPVDRTLWAWGRNEVKDKWTGIIKIDTKTGKGTPVKQLNYKLHDMGGLAWSFEGHKLYASGDEHLWVYDLDSQTFDIACDFVDDGRIEGLDTQPNGFLLVGVDRKGKNGRETRILAFDPEKCEVVHKRVYKGLKYDDIESIVWPATECNDTSWLADH